MTGLVPLTRGSYRGSMIVLVKNRTVLLNHTQNVKTITKPSRASIDDKISRTIARLLNYT